MQNKGVIFDFNGTLFFDSKKHEEAWNAMSMQLRGIAFDLNEMKEHMHGRSNHKIIEYLVGKPLSFFEAENLSLQKEEHYRRLCLEDKENTKLVSGAIEYFKYLKQQNIPFTIASASPKINIDFFVDIFSLNDYFDIDKIVYADEKHEDKVTMFQQASQLINTPIENCIIFEDSFSGIKNAITAGCKKIVVINEENNYQNYDANQIACFIKDFHDDRLYTYKIFEDNL